MKLKEMREEKLSALGLSHTQRNTIIKAFYTFTIVQTDGLEWVWYFWKDSLMLSKAAFIWLKAL